jgi:hypothetical protein
MEAASSRAYDQTQFAWAEPPLLGVCKMNRK